MRWLALSGSRWLKPKRGDWLEGWQVGALVVFIVGVVVSVIVPRSALPEGLPPPEIGVEEIAGARDRQRRLAERAEAEELPQPVRLVGTYIRRLGRAEYDRNDREASEALDGLTGASQASLPRFAEELEVMRAYQAGLFAESYCTYLRTGEITDDLIELGGGVLEEFERNGWLRSSADAPRETDVLLSAMFKRRFAALVAPKSLLLPQDPVEERALIGFQLEHPPLAAMVGGKHVARGDWLLARIDELSALEPRYPTLYAKGIVYFRMRQFENAAVAFDGYVQQVQEGPYRVRAVNYLKTAVEESDAAGPRPESP